MRPNSTFVRLIFGLKIGNSFKSRILFLLKFIAISRNFSLPFDLVVLVVGEDEAAQALQA